MEIRRKIFEWNALKKLDGNVNSSYEKKWKHPEDM